MQYTCWPITKTFTSASTTRHLAHTEPMIEKWRLDSDGFMSPFLPPFFLLSLPQRVIQSTLHLFFMSWASMFGAPHPHRLLSRFPKPSPFPSPRSGPHDLAALLSQQDIPGVSALSLIISLTLPSPSPSPAVRQTPHIYACACRRDTNTPIHTGFWHMEGGNLSCFLLFPTRTEGLASQWCLH